MTETGEVALRAEHVDKVIKDFALKEFKMLSVCKIVPTSAEKNTYWTKASTDLTKTVTTGITGTSLGEVPRGAAFPEVTPDFTEVNEYSSKHAAVSHILWEDTITQDLNIIAETLLSTTRAVANSVDNVIITELNTTTQTFGAANTWDNATISLRDPLSDIQKAISYIEIDNIEITNGGGYIVVHPTNKMELISNQTIRSGNLYTTQVTKTGNMESILGMRIISTTKQTENTVTLGIKQKSMSWYQVSGLKTDTETRAGKDYTVSVWMYGVPVLTNNNSACKITGC